MPKHDYVEPYYMVQLSDDDLQNMQTYISKLTERDYHHREIIHNNPIHSQGTDVYRTCEIHYPNKNSVLNQIGKKIFLDVNEKYYEYDLKDIFEFQLIKYYIDKLVCYLHHSAPMANIKSAIKRARQANRRNALKSSQRASARTSIKAFEKALDDKDIEAAGNEFKKTQKLMDKLANKKVLPKNHVARTKSRLNKKLKALKSA